MNDPFGLVGRVVDDRYRVDACVGEGGFGVVYRATHTTFGERRALKLLKVPPSLASPARDAFVRRFVAEGQLVRQLARVHPAIVGVEDVGVVPVDGDAVPYLALEWLDGQPLDAYVATHGPLGEDDARALLGPVLDALGLAHEGTAGLVVAHRDIKPENLFVTRGEGGAPRLRLLDFGIAKVIRGDAALHPTGGATTTLAAFTPLFGAPEQFDPDALGATGPRTDVHAMGLVVGFLLTGRAPFQSRSLGALAREVLAAPRPTPRALGAHVSDALEAACAKALALRPEDRYATATELASALRAARADDAPRAFDGAGVPVAAAREARAADAPRAIGRPRAPIVLLALGASALALASGVVALRWSSGGASPAATAGGASTGIAATRPAASPALTAAAPSAGDARCPVGMVWLDAGTFVMGSNEYDDERPPRREAVGGFCLDRTEVTVGAYATCVAAGACVAPDGGGAPRAVGERDHPVTWVDWRRAVAYCASLGKRLPSEIEWEYAARGGPESASRPRTFPWGAAAPAARACWNGDGNELGKGRRAGTCAVGTHPAGDGVGALHDLAGNVREWTATAYCPPGGARPTPCTSDERVVRGGAWDDDHADELRASNRSHNASTYRDAYVGFRCAAAPR